MYLFQRHMKPAATSNFFQYIHQVLILLSIRSLHRRKRSVMGI